ncbi:hypothetical protein H0H92_013089 [Tricholoma furcatifolium]|nr:hypothetical protein H0H92_013089 [Tricholoma furcatifolium]
MKQATSFVPAVEECSRSFDFRALLAAAVAEQDRESQQEEARLTLIHGEIEDEDVTVDSNRDESTLAASPLEPPEVEDVEPTLNGKRLPKEERWKSHKKLKRKELASRDVFDLGSLPSASSLRHPAGANALAVDTFSMSHVKVAGPGYIGPRSRGIHKKEWTVPELKEAGFEIMKWPDRPCAITDSEHRVVAVLIGRPTHPDWDRVTRNAAVAIDEFCKQAIAAGLLADGKYQDNRRGNFHALASGISMGGGRTKPGPFVHPPALKKLLDDLLEKEEMQRIGHFQSKALFQYAPKLYEWLCNKIGGLMKGFKRNFLKSVFPVITLNIGPQTQCFIHLDQNNVANGLCIITALGDYDPEQSGLFVMPDLKLAVEYPPGMSLALPSATIPHGNTLVQPGESRFSVTQYCAGGLIRWVDYGCETAKQLSSTPEGRRHCEEIDGPPGSRWEQMLHLFSKFEELAQDRQAVLERGRAKERRAKGSK